MTLFSKITDRNIRIVSVLYYPIAGGFQIVSQRTPVYWTQFVRNGEHPVVMCVYRYANGDHCGVELMVKFMDKLNKSTNLFELSRSDVWFVYCAWRRAYASGYDASRTFNYYGVSLPNPMIPADQMNTFDIRLGYVITMDGMAREAIGTGSIGYSAPRRSRTV